MTAANLYHFRTIYTLRCGVGRGRCQFIDWIKISLFFPELRFILRNLSFNLKSRFLIIRSADFLVLERKAHAFTVVVFVLEQWLRLVEIAFIDLVGEIAPHIPLFEVYWDEVLDVFLVNGPKNLHRFPNGHSFHSSIVSLHLNMLKLYFLFKPVFVVDDVLDSLSGS